MSGGLIAVIDDDESVRLALGGLLRLLGFETLLFDSGEAYLTAQPRVQPVCIISDVQMPGLSGLELKRHLDTGPAPAPIIFITARSEPHVLKQATSSGAVCLLRKPFTEEALTACLEKAHVI